MAGAALAAREVDDVLDDVLAALVRRVRLAGDEHLDRPAGIDEQLREPLGLAEQQSPARLYVAKRRAKPIVSASGSRPPAPRVRAMNSSIRFFAARCAAQSTSSSSSSARAKSGDRCPSRSSSSSRDPRPGVDAVRDRRDRHLVDRPVGPQVVPHLARHLSVQLGDAVRVRRGPEREGRETEPRFLGCTLPSSRELVPREAAALGERLEVPAGELAVEHLVPGRDGRVRREDRRRAQPLERLVLVDALVLDELAQPLELEEGRMAFVEVEDGRVEPELAQHADTAHAEHDLLAQPVLAVAAVERVGRVARPVGIAFDLRVDEVERHAADLRAPHAEPHRHELPVAVREQDGGRHRHEREREPARVVPRIALDLAVALVEPLPEVAAAVEEADADERDAELGGRLQVVAREDAEAAGVRRQHLVEAELGREVGDEHVVAAVVLLPPGDALGLRFEPLLDAPEAQRVLGRQRAREVAVGQLREERGEVVAELGEPRREPGRRRAGARPASS